MRAYVTGATGFVGSHLVDALLARGAEVTCVVRKTSNLRWLRDKPVRTVEGDFDVNGATHVFHVAGVIQAPTLDEFMRGNRDLTRRLVQACRGRPLERFVLVSSLAAAGPSLDGRPRVEEDPPRPVSNYGRSKLAGELETRALECPVTIIRPPVVYGPRDEGLLELFKVVSSAGIEPVIGARKRYSIVHVDDLTAGVLRAASAEPGLWYATNEEPVESDRLVALVARAVAGKRGRRIHVPDGALRALADVLAFAGLDSMFNPDKAREITQKGWLCSGARARDRLGFLPQVPLERGLAETAAWYRREGWI
jgi:dihydroflavonol-4-reductase